MNKLQKCLEYCKQQNGLPYCKNCGLTQEIVDETDQRWIAQEFVKEAFKLLERAKEIKKIIER